MIGLILLLLFGKHVFHNPVLDELAKDRLAFSKTPEGRQHNWRNRQLSLFDESEDIDASNSWRMME